MKNKILKIYHFLLDDTSYYAASLSFFTIFSILPLIALLIYTLSYLPDFKSYLDLLMFYIMDFVNPTHSQSLAIQINKFLTNTDKLGDIGIFYLLFVFTMFFRDYEHVVNKIFDTPTRPIYKLFFMYIGFMLLIPILFILFVFISTFAKFFFSAEILAFGFIWIIFILLFLLSANTHISFKAAAVSSFFTIVVLTIVKSWFGLYVMSNHTYATIYGSFSVALFFFLWIYISWNIYLLGIKLCNLINKSGSIYDKK